VLSGLAVLGVGVAAYAIRRIIGSAGVPGDAIPSGSEREN